MSVIKIILNHLVNPNDAIKLIYAKNSGGEDLLKSANTAVIAKNSQ